MEVNFRNLNILFLALLLGQLLFAGVAYFLNMDKDPAEAAMKNADFAILVPGALLAGFLGAYLLDKAQANKAPVKGTPEEKLTHYRTSLIIRLALMEGANFLAIIAYFLTQENIYLVYAALGIGAFVMFRPTISQFSQRYHVSGKELEQLTS